MVNGTVYQRVENNVYLKELIEKRQRFTTILSIVMLAIHTGFTLLIVFTLGWLGIPLNSNTSATRGTPVSAGVVVIFFVLIGTCIWRANGESNHLNNEVLHEVRAS